MSAIMPPTAVAVERQIVEGVDFFDRRQVAMAETPEDAERIADALNLAQDFPWIGDGPTPEEAGGESILAWSPYDPDVLVAMVWNGPGWRIYGSDPGDGAISRKPSGWRRAPRSSP